MHAHFPPGATTSKQSRRSSRWREFAFMFRQLLRAVMPWLSLRETIEAWGQISADLAEPPRDRKSHEEKLLEAEEEFGCRTRSFLFLNVGSFLLEYV